MAPTDVTGPNAAYVAQLLEDYRDAPASVPAEWRRIFEESERRPSGATDGAGPPGNGSPPSLARAPAPPVAPTAAPGDPSLLGAVAAAMALVKAYRMHGHLAARLDPLRSAAEGGPPPHQEQRRRHLTRRAPARPLSHARAPGPNPSRPPAPLRPRRHAARGAPAAARGVHGIERLRDRAHLGSRRARLAAQGDRVRSLPRPARAGATDTPAAAPGPGRGLRAVPAPVVPRPEAVLARRARRPHPDARRGDRARRRGGRAPGGRRDGTSR